MELQQYLPLAVLKLNHDDPFRTAMAFVATVLTACGIETPFYNYEFFIASTRVATVLTACGIETE